MSLKINDQTQARLDQLHLGYQDLGKNVHHHWGSKLFLSYSAMKGFEVKELNIFQLFLRKIFGCYQETHLKLVNKAWWKAKNVGYQNQALDKRLHQIWDKHYLLALKHKESPRIGTHPQVYCFGEFHKDDEERIEAQGKAKYAALFGDEEGNQTTIPEVPTKIETGEKIWTFRKTIAEFIEAHYQEGDVILVEGVTAGEDASHSNMVKYLKGNYVIHGWEFPHVAVDGEAFSASQEKIDKHFSLLFKAIPKARPITDSDLIPLNRAVNDFLKELSSLGQYFGEEGNAIAEESEIYFQKIMRIWKIADVDDPIALFQLCLMDHQQEFQKFYLKVLRKPNSNENLKHRNISLCDEIEKHTKNGCNVFVITGLSHLLSLFGHGVKQETLSEIHDILKQHSATVILERKRFGFATALLNPNLEIVESY